MPRRRVIQRAMEGAGEGNINKQTPWESGGMSKPALAPGDCPACCQQHQGVGLGSGPGRKGPTQAAPARPPAHSQAQPGMHTQRWLEVAMLGLGLAPGASRGV